VTTYWEMNPAYRVWTADAATGTLLDHETLYMDLTDPRSVFKENSFIKHDKKFNKNIFKTQKRAKNHANNKK
jgi:hypothetical protein